MMAAPQNNICSTLAASDKFLKGDGIIQGLGLNTDAFLDGVVLAFFIL